MACSAMPSPVSAMFAQPPMAGAYAPAMAPPVLSSVHLVQRFPCAKDAHDDLVKCRNALDFDGLMRHFGDTSVVRFVDWTTQQLQVLTGTAEIRGFYENMRARSGDKVVQSVQMPVVEVDEAMRQVFVVGESSEARMSGTYTVTFGVDYKILSINFALKRPKEDATQTKTETKKTTKKKGCC